MIKKVIYIILVCLQIVVLGCSLGFLSTPIYPIVVLIVFLIFQRLCMKYMVANKSLIDKMYLVYAWLCLAIKILLDIYRK